MNLRNWPELLDLGECLDLAWTARDATFLTTMLVSHALPSYKARFDIRSSILTALDGHYMAASTTALVYLRNWNVNLGANVMPGVITPRSIDDLFPRPGERRCSCRGTHVVAQPAHRDIRPPICRTRRRPRYPYLLDSVASPSAIRRRKASRRSRSILRRPRSIRPADLSERHGDRRHAIEFRRGHLLRRRPSECEGLDCLLRECGVRRREIDRDGREATTLGLTAGLFSD